MRQGNLNCLKKIKFTRLCWFKESKAVILVKMPHVDDHTKEKKVAETVAVQVKPFPGKAPDESVFADKFTAANKIGRTIKEIKQPKR